MILSEGDAKELVAYFPGHRVGGPLDSWRTSQVLYGNNNWAMVICGVTHDYLTIPDVFVAVAASD